jgi:hypothetical protein
VRRALAFLIIGGITTVGPTLYPRQELDSATIMMTAVFLIPYAVLADSVRRTSLRVTVVALLILVLGNVGGIALSTTSSTGGLVFLLILPVQLAVGSGARNFS